MPTEKEKLELEKRLYGITSANRDILNLDSVEKSVKLIKNATFPDSVRLTSKAVNSRRIIKVAKKDFARVFSSLNRQVLYADEQVVERIGRQNMLNSYPNQLLIQKLKDNATSVDIFDIPLYYEQSPMRFGATCFPNILRDDSTYLSSAPLTVSWIEINGPADYISTIMYEHELIHPLMRRQRGIIGDYYHEEVLPILIEQIMGLECDETEELLKKMQVFRLESYQVAIQKIKDKQDDQKEIHHMHLISGLIANCIFDRYYNETTVGRNYLLGEVQSILNGEKTLDNFLQEQAISLSTNEVMVATEHSIAKSLIKK